MSWTEIQNQPPLIMEWNGRRFGERRYTVWGNVKREAVINTPQNVRGGGDDGEGNEGLPMLRSTWQGMRLDSYEVSQNGVVLDVIARYSSEGQTGEFGITFQSQDSLLEYGSLVPVRAFGQSSQQNAKYTYAIKSLNILQSVLRVSAVRFVETFNENTRLTVGAIVSLVQSQQNHLHKVILGQGDSTGEWLRFEGADMRRISGSMYALAYSWLGETGVGVIAEPPGNRWTPPVNTPAPGTEPPPSTPATTVPIDIYPGPFRADPRLDIYGLFSRPPFHVVRYRYRVSASIPQHEPPQFYTFCPYEIEPNGAFVLPGFAR